MFVIRWQKSEFVDLFQIVTVLTDRTNINDLIDIALFA